MEVILANSNDIKDLKGMLAGIGVQVAKEEYSKRLAGELLLGGR